MPPFKVLPLAGVLLLAAMVFVWRPWLQRRRHGTWGVVLFKGSAAQKLRDAMLLVLPLLLVAQAAVAVASPDALLLFGGLLLQAVAMLDLGASWRIGIDVGRLLPGIGKLD